MCTEVNRKTGTFKIVFSHFWCWFYLHEDRTCDWKTAGQKKEDGAEPGCWFSSICELWRTLNEKGDKDTIRYPGNKAALSPSSPQLITTLPPFKQWKSWFQRVIISSDPRIHDTNPCPRIAPYEVNLTVLSLHHHLEKILAVMEEVVRAVISIRRTLSCLQSSISCPSPSSPPSPSLFVSTTDAA